MAVTHCLKSMGITEVRTSLGWPWPNAYVERFIGTIRRECLHHIVVLNERHPGGSLGLLGLLPRGAISPWAGKELAQWTQPRTSRTWRDHLGVVGWRSPPLVSDVRVGVVGPASPERLDCGTSAVSIRQPCHRAANIRSALRALCQRLNSVRTYRTNTLTNTQLPDGYNYNFIANPK